MSGRLANTNPFVTDIMPGLWWASWIGATTCDERIEMIRDFDADQCLAALRAADLQKTCRERLLARIRRIAREEKRRKAA